MKGWNKICRGLIAVTWLFLTAGSIQTLIGTLDTLTFVNLYESNNSSGDAGKWTRKSQVMEYKIAVSKKTRNQLNQQL